MNKLKLLEILSRYCKSLESAEGKTVITNYGRMRSFIKSLNKEELGEELCCLFDRLVIKEALKIVRKRNINLKENSLDWDKKSIAKGYQLSKEIESLLYSDSKKWEEKMKELAELAYGEPSVGTQLCLMGLFLKGAESPNDDLERLEELYETD